MKKIYILFSVILLSVVSIAQNKFHLSQSMMYQPFINPAVISSYSGINGALFYKAQWTGFAGAPEIGGFNINTPIKASNGAFGFGFTNDRIGISRINDVSLTYSYKLKISEDHYISTGISGSLIMMQSDLNALDIIQVNDPVFSSNTPTTLMPNFKFGAYYFTNNFYLGLGIPNILKNQVSAQFPTYGVTSFEPENIHFYLHTGMQREINNDWDANTSLLIKQVSGAPTQIGINSQFTYQDKIGVGIAYRTSQEISFLLNYKVIDDLKVAYAFDWNLDKIGNYSNGTHEIMLIFDIKNRKEIPIIEVPRF